MSLDDRYDEFVSGLGGFYRTWFVFVGLELGLLARVRQAGATGITPAELAAATGTDPGMVRWWAWGSAAHRIVEDDGERLRMDADVAGILLDADRPEYLGGQMVYAATASLDYGPLLDVVRSGAPMRGRPDRYRTAIERLTLQDVAVFFQEGLVAMPNLVTRLRGGAEVIDVHCGGGRWLIAMAKRFPDIRLTGIEFEPDSVARARANVAAAGLAGRISIEQAEPAAIDRQGTVTLAYFQYALHQLADPAGALASAWASVRPGGWLVVMEWYLPTDPDELLSRHGELIAGVQLDELFQGTRLVSRAEALEWFRAAGVPDPRLTDLPSGATIIAAERA